MATLADIMLEVARAILDVVESAAEGGTTTTLTDTVGLRQDNHYFDGGTIWFLSGTNAGKVRVITSHKNGGVGWTTALGAAPLAGDRYAVTRSTLPYRELRQAVNDAFDVEASFVLAENTSLTAAGQSSFTLPAGVSDVEHIEVVDAAGNRTPDYHHRERIGKLYFDNPPTGTLALQYRKRHDLLLLDSDAISSEINLEWLKWKAVENVLHWGFRFLMNDPVLKIDVFLNEAIDKLKTLRPRRSISVKVRTGG